jgi:AcrR family transcriptional regulator
VLISTSWVRSLTDASVRWVLESDFGRTVKVRKEQVRKMKEATKAGAPARPTAEAILSAACRVIAGRGVEATRIADIAREAGTSTGTVHYYFETKDDVLLAALQWANERPYDHLEELLGLEADDLSRLATLLELSIPYPGPARDEWVFVLELWFQILHRPELRPAGQSFDSRWRGYFYDVVRSGAESGAFSPSAPVEEVADRLVALVDGLGLKSVLGGESWITPKRMREMLLRFAADELGVDYEELDRRARAG